MGFLLRCFQQLSYKKPHNSYPTFPLFGTRAGTPLVRPSWSSRTRENSSQCSKKAFTGYGPNCLTTFWTQLTYRFQGRTAQPLARTTAPGCDEPTSRCQTFPSMWTLGEDQPVIPRVTFVRWATALPRGYVGSLRPALAPVWLVSLTVKPPCCLYTPQLISVQLERTLARLRYFLGGDRPSQTNPLKLSPRPRKKGTFMVSLLALPEWYLTSGSLNRRNEKPWRLPPMLRDQSPNAIPGYSQAS